MSATRGPRLHRIQNPGGASSYSYGGDKNPSDKPWECTCGSFGQGEVAALQHLAVKAKQAWRRLDNMKALATAVVASGPKAEHDALGLLYRTRAWTSHDGIRRRLVPFYDTYGVLSASMNWKALAHDVTIGRITGGFTDLLILRIAIAVTGTPILLELSGLWRLSHDEARLVREVLIAMLPGDST